MNKVTDTQRIAYLEAELATAQELIAINKRYILLYSDKIRELELQLWQLEKK